MVKQTNMKVVLHAWWLLKLTHYQLLLAQGYFQKT
jgi:hypothetical protein